MYAYVWRKWPVAIDDVPHIYIYICIYIYREREIEKSQASQSVLKRWRKYGCLFWFWKTGYPGTWWCIIMFHLETSETICLSKTALSWGILSNYLYMFRSASWGTLQCSEVGGQSVHRSGSESGSAPLEFPEISIGRNSEELISLVTIGAQRCNDEHERRTWHEKKSFWTSGFIE